MAHLTPDAPDLPEGGELIWAWFWELSAQRGSGPEHLAFADIEAWSRMSGNHIAPWALSILSAMDRQYVSSMRDEIRDSHERERNKKKTKMDPSQVKT